jgi:hypothetical protein
MIKGGVQPRTAQAAMRHSRIEMTMSVYWTFGALDALPTLPLRGDQSAMGTAAATGTDGGVPRTVAPLVAPTRDNSVQPRASAVNLAGKGRGEGSMVRLAVSGFPVNGNDPLTIIVSGSDHMGATGFEPVTPSVSSWCDTLA